MTGRVLLSIRLSRNSLERKMGFLAPPISSIDQAYFDGYMTVKRLYADLTKSVPAFRDSNLFLAYVRTFFFDDAQLATLIASSPDDPLRRLRDVNQRFIRRFNQLLEPDLAARVSAFEAACNRPPDVPVSLGERELHLSDAELAAGDASQAALLAELDDQPDTPQELRAALHVQSGWIERRALINVGVELVSVRVRNGAISVSPREADAFDQPLVMGTALPGVADTPRQVDGWISLMLHPVRQQVAFVVGDEHRTLAINLRGGYRDADVQLFDDPLFSPLRAQMEHEAVEAWIDQYLSTAPPPVQDFIAHCRRAADATARRVTDFFLRRWKVAKDGPDGAVTLRQTDRLRGLLGNRPLFETFAAFGILRDRDVLLPSFREWLIEQGWDPGPALTSALKIERTTGVALVMNDDGVFRWLV